MGGYPTIKSGDPSALEDYSGGRDADDKAAIDKLMALTDEDIAKQIADGDKQIADADTHFNAELEKLQATYKELTATKEQTIKDVKASGLGMLKAVQAQKKKAPEAVEEKKEL